jgi:RNA polymerase sigma factor (sigma-70 family)
VTEVPAPTTEDRNRITLLFHYCRMQFPDLTLPEERFRQHLTRTFQRFLHVEHPTEPVGWAEYLNGLHALDWLVAVGCVEGLNPAWELLFSARTGRTEGLLIDALRARAHRLYPRDTERQEEAVTEFWGSLIISESASGEPVLSRYDGRRPLAPWLIRVFQNMHLSRLRKSSGIVSLPDDDWALPLPAAEPVLDRWREPFCEAARDWMTELNEHDRLIIGLRWRYKMSQREVAKLFNIHEGTLSRQTDKLRDRALESIGEKLIAQGWTGDELREFILTEMGGLLIDDPHFSAEALARLMASQGITISN